jgi:two-component system chemotaxis response regulator CheY
MGQKNRVMEAVSAGAPAVFVKPFQPEKVMEAVSKVIG